MEQSSGGSNPPFRTNLRSLSREGLPAVALAKAGLLTIQSFGWQAIARFGADLAAGTLDYPAKTALPIGLDPQR